MYTTQNMLCTNGMVSTSVRKLGNNHTGKTQFKSLQSENVEVPSGWGCGWSLDLKGKRTGWFSLTFLSCDHWKIRPVHPCQFRSRSYGVKCYQSTNDFPIFCSLSLHTEETILECCLCLITSWVRVNKLKNPDKAEMLLDSIKSDLGIGIQPGL